MTAAMKFNTPPGWPPPPDGWTPSPDWRPDPAWPPAPPGWVFWIPDDKPAASQPQRTEPEPGAQPEHPLASESLAEPPAEPTFESEPESATESTGSPQSLRSGGRHSAGRSGAGTEQEPAPDTEAAPPPSDSPAPDPSAVEPPSAHEPLTDGPEPEGSVGFAAHQLAAARAELVDVQAATARERTVLHELERQVRGTQGGAIDARSAAGPSGPTEEAAVAADIAAARRQLVELNDALLLQQVGIYEYHHPLENADAYKERLTSIRERIKDTVRTNQAIAASDRFAYNNSLAQGRKMTADFSKLMLRAYNAEADNCVRSLRAGSVDAAIKRLNTSVDTIARLGSMMQMRVTPEYHALRIEELELTSDYLFMMQEERERSREEREQLREQRRAEQELAAERDRLEKERQHYVNALAALKAKVGSDADANEDLARHLAEIDAAIELNDYRVANIRAGYVYVISNLGAFGSRVVKIGLTRRLDPMDRVRELGDASVPFPFDVHALYFSDDAVALEAQLHAEFADRRVNHVNLRREFFFATPAQVREVLKTKVGNLLEFTEEPEATQFHQSMSGWPADVEGATPAGSI